MDFDRRIDGRREMRFLIYVILILVGLLLSKCTIVHFRHDAAAQQLLVSLRRLPLPRGAQVRYEQAEVGSFTAATGDNTDVLAYRVFITDLPEESVSEFFAPFLKPREFAVGFCRLDKPPQSPYLPIISILEHIPQSERSRAYILYSTDLCEEDGIWDVRGW